MMWEPMTIDELASYQRACGVRVMKIRGTWWVEPRPFFFRTLYPLAEIDPQFARYPLQHLVGGVLHLVPSGVASNTNMKLFLYDHLQEYALDKLATKPKWVIKKSLENFQARKILDQSEFIETAFPIYQAFYDRTKYSYKKERSEKVFFSTWARTLFAYPKIMITGAYHQDKLCAVDISYQVDDLIIDDVFFSNTESQGMRVTDFMVHTLREAAAGTGSKYLFRGFPSGKQSLDESKVRRGCKIFRIPAYRKINPVALYVGKLFMNESYRKLMTITTNSYLDGPEPESAAKAAGSAAGAAER
jgi:hypothetical protein